MPLDRLNHRQRAFAHEYLVDLNGAQAVLRAGYRVTGQAAAMHANRLMRNDDIAQFIKLELEKRNIANQFTVAATQDEIRALSHSDPRGVFNEDGTVKLPREWSDETARTVAGFEVREEYGDIAKSQPAVVRITKIKFWGKPESLALKGRMQKLFIDVTEHRVDGETADRLSKARERAKAISEETD
jgi:phage terminase small subunit